MTRRPVVAGLFYPDAADELAATVDALLDDTEQTPQDGLHALVAPHAGYAYSGAVAASAFALAPRSARVVLLGPSHYAELDGLAVSGADAWATPLGEVPVAADLRDAAVAAGAVVDERPHARDHALEVELPFLQRSCPEGLEILPVAVGRTQPEDVAAVLAVFEALVVVSTDLSHYHPEVKARELDRRTARAVLEHDPGSIADDGACGAFALRGLVEHARRSELSVELLDLRTSADSTGDRERVVGYGAFSVTGVA